MRSILIAATLALLCACTDSVDRKPAEDAVQKFHAALDAGQYDRIYDASAGALRAGTPHDRFVEQLSAIHAKLGAPRVSTQKKWTLRRRESDALLTLEYATVYAGGEADEAFVWRMQGDLVELVEYRIHSAALDGTASPR